MERKFREDMDAHKIEQVKIQAAYLAWLEQMEYYDEPSVKAAFRGGYAQGKYDSAPGLNQGQDAAQGIN